jgi:arabinose-5-phosphate isomerase
MLKDIKNAKDVVLKEKNEVLRLLNRFGEKKFQKNFSAAIDSIFKCKGKVVVSGVGKSGIIAQKIVATFNSTGTHSVFLHSADSIHGDLGIIEADDVVVLISKSGESDEIKNIIPYLKNIKIKIILITGSLKSSLAKVSDILIDASVQVEACPHNLAPTSSSTVMLIIGDALAVTLLQKRGFTKEDFAFIHPGGILGKKLLLRIEDIMVKGNDIPVVVKNAKLKDVIYQISSKRLGCAVVMGKSKIEGFITDGDIRRLLENDVDVRNVLAKDLMNPKPKTILKETLAKTALEMMEKNKITQLIIVDSKTKLSGILHIHTLIQLGL